MMLCLDVGNSHIFGGVFDEAELCLRFRMDSGLTCSSDQYGIFMKSVLRENEIAAERITHIALCSVVPQLDYSLKAACRKYFGKDPFILEAGVKTGLNIKIRNPLELGADRVANAIAATHLYPGRNLLIFDLGTGTTLCAVSKERAYLGGAIWPGIKMSMQALESGTAKLFAVPIVRPQALVGRTTLENIQIGLYYGQCATMRELSQRIKREYFHDDPELLRVGTGGFAYLFADEQLFDVLHPDLVLHGLRFALQENL